MAQLNGPSEFYPDGIINTDSIGQAGQAEVSGQMTVKPVISDPVYALTSFRLRDKLRRDKSAFAMLWRDKSPWQAVIGYR